MKRIAVLIVFILSLSAAFLNADAAERVYVSGDFEYTLTSNGTAEITNYIGSVSELVIPESLDGYHHETALVT